MKTVYLAYSTNRIPGEEYRLQGFVWIGEEGDPNTRHTKVYKSFDYPKMIVLAADMASEHNLSKTTIALDIVWDHISTIPAKKLPEKVLKAMLQSSA